MADINLNPYTAESEAIAKKLRMAELLQQQAMQPIELPTMPGVRVSPLSGLAKLLQAYGASKQSERATEEQKALAQRYQGDVASDFQSMIRALQAPAQAGQPTIEPTFQEGQSTITQGGQPAMPARPAGYLPAEGLSGIKTDTGRQAYMAQLLAQATPKAPIKLGPDESLLHPTTFETVATGKGKETYHPPVNEFDPNSGQTLKVAYSNLGTRKVIETGGAYTPDQWNAIPMADKAKMIFEQYKFGNLSAEQLLQAGQKNAQLGQELVKLQFETGKGGPGPVPIPANAPMPTAVSAPVAAPTQPVAGTIAPPVAPVVQPRAKGKPYTPLNAPTVAPAVAPAAANMQPTVADQPPAGLSPKAQQQWIVENSKNQIQATKDKPQAELSATTALTNLSRMKNVAQELSQHKGLDKIVGKWNQYSIFDTSDNAVNARALQGTLVKQSATASLQAMRDASKTGGAVGSVSEKEWPILEQQIAALDSAQTPKAYKVALQNLQSQVDSSMTNIRKAYEIQHGKLEFTPPKYYKQDEVQPSAWKVVK
jgi:hypothetical protein